MPARIDIAFRLNGVGKRASVAPETSALEMLREVIGLTGTKYGCGEGECGACTVRVDGATVNSCLMFAVDCDGRELVTVEGLTVDGVGERLRDAFVANGAVQCGFCTPGNAFAARVSIETIFACRSLERRIFACSCPGRLMSWM